MTSSAWRNCWRTPGSSCRRWLICSGNNESAGKQLSGKTRNGNAALRAALGEAALAVTRTKDTSSLPDTNAYPPSAAKTRDRRCPTLDTDRGLAHADPRPRLPRPRRLLLHPTRWHEDPNDNADPKLRQAGGRACGHRCATLLTHQRLHRHGGFKVVMPSLDGLLTTASGRGLGSPGTRLDHCFMSDRPRWNGPVSGIKFAKPGLACRNQPAYLPPILRCDSKSNQRRRLVP